MRTGITKEEKSPMSETRWYEGHPEVVVVLPKEVFSDVGNELNRI